MYEAQNKNIL